jgi:hypothetical protein
MRGMIVDQEGSLLKGMMPAEGTIRCPFVREDFGPSRFKGNL